ncbi:hypothetical protein ACFGT7_004015, partial [Citrobacter amalonaticus]
GSKSFTLYIITNHKRIDITHNDASIPLILAMSMRVSFTARNADDDNITTRFSHFSVIHFPSRRAQS